MRTINRYNYEEFFLDYLEGKLSDSELKNLEDFLSHHPDLKEELDEMSLLELEEETVEFDKSALKDIPFESDFDEFCIAKLEGDLEKEQDEAFTKYLNHNLIGKAQYQQYGKTKLTADMDVVYPHKEDLKRKDRKILPYWMLSGVGVAASVLILFSLWNTSISEKDAEQLTGNKVAYIDTVKKIKIEPNNDAESLESVLAKKTEPVRKENNNSDREEAVKTIVVKLPQENKAEKPVAEKKFIAEQTKEEQHQEAEKISLPEVVKTAELEILDNIEIAEYQVEVPKQEEVHQEVPVNSGLANLGMSWKSSVKDKKKNNSLLYAVAKMGVDKLGAIAGKKVQLEKQYDSETEKTRVNFNTKGIGFSTSIK